MKCVAATACRARQRTPCSKRPIIVHMRGVRIMHARLFITLTYLAATSMLVGCDPVTVEELLEERGYAPFSPPNDSLGPGTIVAVKDGKIESILCTTEESIGADFEPHKSHTASITITERSGAGVDLSIDLWHEIT